MKTPIAITAMLVLLQAGSALAGPQRAINRSGRASELRALQARDGHPLTSVIPARGIEVKIKHDLIMRSCCLPPALVVAGEVTNTASVPLDYVRFILTFEDSSGKVVHTESLYNRKAASMNDDTEIERILNEHPHFEALPPGASDKFAFNVLMPALPHFTRVELVSEPARGLAAATLGAR
jgi:hypothetical protein